MNHSNVVTIKTEAARNEYLRACPAAELSNEDLLDAQRATAGDIEKDGTDGKLRARYNALATEYGEGGGMRLIKDKGMTELQAFAVVERRIKELGAEHVLPNYSKIYQRDATALSTDAPSVRYTNTGRVIR